MSTHTGGHAATNARRGLATIALLKARFDAGMKGHLDMFQPFVEDAIRRCKEDDIEVSSIHAAVRDLTGLRIPAGIIKTLLKRAKKKGLLIREGGRFLRKLNYDEDSGLATKMRGFAHAHAGLASRLRQFAASRGQELPSDDDALAVLMRFLDTNHIGLVLGQPIEMEPSDEVVQLDHVVAAFVSNIVKEDGPDSSVLDDIVKGLIVQNALLLRDIPITRRHLKGLTVFIDTGILLYALGYAGHTEQQAATEALGLIRAAGARLKVFERTVDEVKGILRVYEEKLGSSAGVRSLRGTPLTYHFLGTKTTPSYIQQEILLVEKNLEQLGIRTRDFPKHVVKFTEAEEALAKALRDPARNEDTYDHRVWHDVQAVAAVLTLRAGSRSSQMASSRYIFASGSTRTVMTATRWYRERYRSRFEPMVHFRSVANSAWFLRPANAAAVPMHELVAVCAAVLRPSPEVWAGCVRHLDNFVKSGELSDDESIVLLADGFTRIEPSEFESESDVEADTVREIVERVREEQQEEHRSQLADKQKQIEDSKREATTARSEADSIRSGVQARAERLATFGAGVICAVLGIVLFRGASLTLPSEWSDWIRSGSIWKLVCIVVFLGVSLLGGVMLRFRGLTIFGHLKAYLSPRLQRWLLPENEDGDS